MLVLIIQCQHKDNRKQNDISQISNPLPTIRLEQDLYAIPKNQTKEGIDKLTKEYPVLMDFYLKAVLELDDTSKSRQYTYNVLDELIHHPDMVKLNDTIQLVFKDFEKYEKELNLVIKNYQYYFPGMPVPRLVTYTSQFGPKSFYYKNYLGVGLDLYLGVDYPYYSSMGFPNFIIKRLQQKYITSDAAFVITQDLKDEPLKRGASLLDMMVYYGKLYYIASYLLPEKPMEDFFYYSKEDWQWCVNNEKEIWAFLIDGDWLFDNTYIDYGKFINDAPTTMGMPQGAPDRVGRWVGYQIVKKYMKNFPNTSFQELLKMESGQEILNHSKYKPSKS
ncbi:MAG: DUF2268 domain-containing putative Zn-dependent protease [Chitinophagales bacterium]|nr:DUF2268 domain-containing putative Zn-dependent protease [Chitinophagales bacterium]